MVIGEIYGAVFVDDKRLYRFDAELGWAPKSDFTYDRMRSDVAGNAYRLKLTTNEAGFGSGVRWTTTSRVFSLSAIRLPMIRTCQTRMPTLGG